MAAFDLSNVGVLGLFAGSNCSDLFGGSPIVGFFFLVMEDYND